MRILKLFLATIPESTPSWGQIYNKLNLSGDHELAVIHDEARLIASGADIVLCSRQIAPEWIAFSDNADEIGDTIGDLLGDHVLSKRPDPMSTDENDTVAVCNMCSDVEGHKAGCPVPAMQQWVRYHDAMKQRGKS